MSEIKLYPEMDAKIVGLLRFDDESPVNLYAAALIEHLQAELAAYRQAEAEGKKYERWTPTSKRLPSPGETVEIMRIADRIMAVYEPEENHHCPWRLIDFTPNGIWHRSKDAVTHWRSAIEKGE